MAILSAMGGVEQIAWSIEELGSAFTDEFYLGAGICLGAFENGTYDEPEDILQYVDATSVDRFDHTARGTKRNLEPGRYAIYGFTHTPGDGGRYWNVWPESGKNALIITVKSSAPAVEPWDWNTSNGEATAAETSLAYDILMGTRPVSDGFSHKVWNDLVAKVAEMRSALGFTWDEASGLYLAQSECKVSAGDTLSAEIYNAVRYQVGAVQGTGITDRAPDDKMLGYHITHMVDVLNQIINEQL